MKIDELEKNKMPHLYLDMDGVQADFFGAWADKHNVSHWKAITNKENEIEELANSTPENVYSFFRDLRPLKGGMEIVKWIQDNNIPYTVLSAPLRGPYADVSKQAKRDWLDDYHPGSSANAIFTSRKQQYAVTDGVANVLVVTITGANVTGNIVSSNNITSKYFINSAVTGVSAAGTTQGTATQIGNSISVITTVSSGANNL